MITFDWIFCQDNFYPFPPLLAHLFLPLNCWCIPHLFTSCVLFKSMYVLQTIFFLLSSLPPFPSFSHFCFCFYIYSDMGKFEVICIYCSSPLTYLIMTLPKLLSLLSSSKGEKEFWTKCPKATSVYVQVTSGHRNDYGSEEESSCHTVTGKSGWMDGLTKQTGDYDSEFFVTHDHDCSSTLAT